MSRLSNQIEGNDNEDENKLYKYMVNEIIKNRKENKKNITVIANTL